MPLLQVFFTALPIVALLTYCALILFFGISQKDKFIRAFMWIIGALIVWSGSAVFMSIELYPGVLFWDRIMVAGMLAVPFFLYYFVSIFVNSFKRLHVVVLAIISIAAIMINFMGYVAAEMHAVIDTVTLFDRQFRTVEYIYTLGPGTIPVYMFMFAAVLAVLGKAKISLRKGHTSHGQISPVIWGIGIMFAGCLVNLVPAAGKYPIDVLTCLINAILIFIAIYKYRMVELRFMLTKGLVYAVFASILTVVYIFAVFYVQNHAGAYYGKIVPYFTTITALVVAIAFQPLYRLAGMFVGKLFYKTDYSQRQALRHFSEHISNKLDLTSIARELIEAVQLALHTKQILVLLKDDEQKHYFVFQTSSQVFKPDLAISFENPMIWWMGQNKAGLTRAQLQSLPIFKAMWETEKRTLHDLDIELVIPIKLGEDIIGLLMLTGKRNNIAYTMEDMDLLNYLGASTAVAFENARLYNLSQQEAITDNLTKLFNHRYFYKVLAEQMDKIGSAELSLIMLDLDLFKLYNDLYGHFEGDRALEMVAAIMSRIVGQKGIVCRYGGEEFTVILPYHDANMAFEVAEKIRIEVQDKFFNMNNSDDSVQRFLTASLGVCTYPHAAPNKEELIKRADLAMYTAKNQGKNQTVIYTPRIAEDLNEEGDETSISNPNYAATIYALTAAIDTKDHYTFGHSQRVADYATTLARNLAFDDNHIEILREAALLHDIGKIGIPEDILTKATRLSNDEFNMIQKHPEMSITIIKHLPTLNHVIPAVMGHHERWDGKGYPRGLKGDSIPITARVLAIADAFDAMTSNRPYSTCMSVNAALNEISNCSGTQFDPVMARIFIKLVRDGKIKVDHRTDMDIKNAL